MYTYYNHYILQDKQEAFDLLIHGTGRNTDFADRVKLLLPIKYFHGNFESATLVLYVADLGGYRFD